MKKINNLVRPLLKNTSVLFALTFLALFMSSSAYAQRRKADSSQIRFKSERCSGYFGSSMPGGEGIYEFTVSGTNQNGEPSFRRIGNNGSPFCDYTITNWWWKDRVDVTFRDAKTGTDGSCSINIPRNFPRVVTVRQSGSSCY